MDHSFDKLTVLRALKELKRRYPKGRLFAGTPFAFVDKILRDEDPEGRVFAAARQKYELLPPLSLDVVEEFEARYSVSLPEDYRYFITEIGNGGAGPYFGLFPFGQHDDGFGLCSWEDGGLVGDLSQPFPHIKAWNLPDSFWKQEPDIPPDLPIEEEDRLWQKWDKVEQEHYLNPAIMNGAIPICHLGCALWQWLVINGDQKGFVWNDYRADRRGIAPLYDGSQKQVTFADWYMSWLDVSLRQAKGRGLKFVGRTICYFFRQAADMVNDQRVRWFRGREPS